MTDKIKAHLDYLLKDAPKTRRIEEMREELLAGCLDKYEDLTASGMTPEDAYTAVISGIGDVDELVASLSKENPFDPARTEQNRRSKALMIAAAVMIFVFAIAFTAVMSLFHLDDFAAIIFILMVGGGVALIIYANMAKDPRYEKKEDTIVEEVKVVMSMGGTEKGNKLLSAASSSLWSLAVLAYLFIGFAFNGWHPGWLIFPFAVFLQTLLNAMLSEPAKRGKHITASIFTGAVFFFLFLGSFTHFGWRFGWMLIILALAVHQIAKLIRVWRETR